MAGAGKKTFASGEVLTASDVNGYLMDQAVMKFADSSARGSAIAAPSEGMVSYLDDTDQLEVYDGASWNGIRNAYAIAAANGTVTGLSIGTGNDSIGLLATVNWPSGRFSQIPTVQVSLRDAGVSGCYKAMLTPGTAGTASTPIYIANGNISTTITAVSFDVLGVQMTAGSATG